MKIIIEYVLIENMLINLMALKTTALISKESGRLFWLSSFLGGCLTVVLPLFRLNSIGSFLVEIGLFVLHIVICFKFKAFKKFLRLYLTYFLVMLLFGGACYFIENYFGITSTIIVLAVVSIVFVVVRFLINRLQRKRQIDNFCFDVEIETVGQKTIWKGFLDSGNFLLDPLTNSPVSLINFKVFSALFHDIEIVDVLTRSEKIKTLKFAHYIRLNTLSVSDKILVFQVDRLCIGNRIVDKPFLGLSLTEFNQAFNSDIILHSSCVG